MKRFFFSFFLSITNASIFAQISSSHLSDGTYTLGGGSVKNAEYEIVHEKNGATEVKSS